MRCLLLSAFLAFSFSSALSINEGGGGCKGGLEKKEKIRPVGRIRMLLEQEAGTLTRIFRLNGGRADGCATSACDGAGDGDRTRVFSLEG